MNPITVASGAKWKSEVMGAPEAEAFAAAVAAAVAVERASVVAWLGKCADEIQRGAGRWGEGDANMLRGYANRIKRGEHSA